MVSIGEGRGTVASLLVMPSLSGTEVVFEVSFQDVRDNLPKTYCPRSLPGPAATQLGEPNRVPAWLAVRQSAADRKCRAAPRSMVQGGNGVLVLFEKGLGPVFVAVERRARDGVVEPGVAGQASVSIRSSSGILEGSSTRRLLPQRFKPRFEAPQRCSMARGRTRRASSASMRRPGASVRRCHRRGRRSTKYHLLNVESWRWATYSGCPCQSTRKAGHELSHALWSPPN